MKYYNPKRSLDLKRMEAIEINKRHSASYRAPVSNKPAERNILETVQGPALPVAPAGRNYNKRRVGVVTQPMDAGRFTTAMINRISVK